MTDEATTLPSPLDRRYAVEGLLGEGGFGRVLRARDRELDREVAIKLLHARLEDEQLKQRFAREALATAAVGHPNVVQVFDHGVAVDGSPYIIYELIAGRPFDEAARGAGEEQVARWGAAVADALQAAHQQDLLHRDVKPENILVREDGHPILCDFGLARDDRVDATRLTMAGAIMGSPPYMAPELWTGETPTAASDQFALAASLYEAIYETRVYTGESPLEIATCATRDFRPRIPRGFEGRMPGLEAALLKALAADARHRYPDLAAFAEALRGDLTVAPAAPEPAANRTIGPGEATGVFGESTGAFKPPQGATLDLSASGTSVPLPSATRSMSGIQIPVVAPEPGPPWTKIAGGVILGAAFLGGLLVGPERAAEPPPPPAVTAPPEPKAPPLRALEIPEIREVEALRLELANLHGVTPDGRLTSYTGTKRRKKKEDEHARASAMFLLDPAHTSLFPDFTRAVGRWLGKIARASDPGDALEAPTRDYVLGTLVPFLEHFLADRDRLSRSNQNVQQAVAGELALNPDDEDWRSFDEAVDQLLALLAGFPRPGLPPAMVLEARLLLADTRRAGRSALADRVQPVMTNRPPGWTRELLTTQAMLLAHPDAPISCPTLNRFLDEVAATNRHFDALPGEEAASAERSFQVLRAEVVLRGVCGDRFAPSSQERFDRAAAGVFVEKGHNVGKFTSLRAVAGHLIRRAWGVTFPEGAKDVPPKEEEARRRDVVMAAVAAYEKEALAEARDGPPRVAAPLEARRVERARRALLAHHRTEEGPLGTRHQASETERIRVALSTDAFFRDLEAYLAALEGWVGALEELRRRGIVAPVDSPAADAAAARWAGTVTHLLADHRALHETILKKGRRSWDSQLMGDMAKGEVDQILRRATEPVVALARKLLPSDGGGPAPVFLLAEALGSDAALEYVAPDYRRYAEVLEGTTDPAALAGRLARARRIARRIWHGEENCPRYREVVASWDPHVRRALPGLGQKEQATLLREQLLAEMHAATTCPAPEGEDAPALARYREQLDLLEAHARTPAELAGRIAHEYRRTTPGLMDPFALAVRNPALRQALRNGLPPGKRPPIPGEKNLAPGARTRLALLEGLAPPKQ